MTFDLKSLTNDDKYWVLNQGQKAGPFSQSEVAKKIEIGVLSMTDMVSVDNGHSWQKLFHFQVFNSHEGGVDTLPLPPLEASFQKAKEELNEWMDSHEQTGTHTGLAALTYLDIHKDKVSLNLDEMDLKSLGETEISRSLRWAIPSAMAGIGVLALLGNFIFSPSTSNELAKVSEEKPETILPETQRPQRVSNQRSRRPASHRPLRQDRSALTQAPRFQQNEYPAQVETHYNEPDPMIDPVSEAEQAPPAEPQEHSLVSNNAPQEGETLDQVMGGGEAEPQAPPEQPVVEEASDF